MNNTKFSSPKLPLFLNLPVHLVHQLLASVDDGHFSDPTDAMLHGLYQGDFLGEGPDPIDELKAALDRIEQKRSKLTK